MPNDSRDSRPEGSPVFPAWGLPLGDAPADLLADPGAWLIGGAALLAWTGVALLLTA